MRQLCLVLPLIHIRVTLTPDMHSPRSRLRTLRRFIGSQQIPIDIMFEDEAARVEPIYHPPKFSPTPF